MVGVYRKRSGRFAEHKISSPYPDSNPGQSIQYRSRSNINMWKVKTDINKLMTKN